MMLMIMKMMIEGLYQLTFLIGIVLFYLVLYCIAVYAVIATTQRIAQRVLACAIWI